MRALRVATAMTAVLAVAAVAAHLRGPSIARALVGRLGEVSPVDAGASVAAATVRAAAFALVYLGALLLAVRRRWSASRLASTLAAVAVIDVTAASLPLLAWTRGDVHALATAPGAAVRARSPGAGGVRLYREPMLDADEPRTNLPLRRAAMLRANLGSAEGIAHLRPYEAATPPRESALPVALAGSAAGLLRTCATRFALLTEAHAPPASVAMPLARYPGAHAVLVEFPGPSPRAYVPSRVLGARSPAQAMAALARADVRPPQDAVIEGAAPRTATGRCDILRDEPETVALRCVSSAPSWSVLADAWFPGWTVTVDGVAAPAAPANLALRAVPIPAGASTVVWSYRPASLDLGLGLTALAAAAMTAAWAWSRRQGARPPSDAPRAVP